MPRPHVRLTEADEALIEQVIRKMVKIGIFAPNTTDAVRYALRYTAASFKGAGK